MVTKEFYTEVKEMLKGNRKILLANILCAVIPSILLTYNLNLNNIYSSYQVGYKANSVFMESLSTLLTSVFTIFLYMECIHFIRTRDFDIVRLFTRMLENSFRNLGVSLIYGLIITILSLIPLVGLVLRVLATYAFTYVAYYLYEDGSKEYAEYFKESYIETNGHKMSLFKIDLHYYKSVIILFVLLALSIFMSIYLDYFNLLLVAGLLLLIIFVQVILISPYILVAKALYYERASEKNI